MGIRLVVVDDNPHVRWRGRVYPVNAAFQRFVAGILDLPGAPVASVVACVPVREADREPAALPLDPRIAVSPTLPFDGIEGYVRGLPGVAGANRPILRRAIARADLLWLKVPASNGALAAALAALAGVPRFTWVAGSARDVGGARFAGARRLAAIAVGAAYDAVGAAAGAGPGGDRILVGADLVRPDGSPGEGVVTSLVEDGEVRETAGQPWPAIPWRLRIGWAGRVAPGKGLDALIGALAGLAGAGRDGRRVELVVIGDGPLSDDLRRRAIDAGVADRLHQTGYVAERAPYLDALAACDLFASPSPAEGFPKVVLDAMAVGLPVAAVPAGQLGPLVDAGIVAPVAAGAGGLAAGIESLASDASRATGLRAAGTRFVRAHTRQAELERLVARWRRRWPGLPW